MKVAIVNFKDKNLAECSSAARNVEYTKEDFKDLNMISDDHKWPTSPHDVRKLCAAVLACKVKNCNVKKAIIENDMTITANISKRKLDEMNKMIKAADVQIKKIKESMEVK